MCGDMAEAARAAADAFGLGPVRSMSARLDEAWSNHVFRVRTARGRYAVKVFPPEADADRLRTGMRLEAAVLTDGRVPIPVPVADPAGDWLVRVGRPESLARCHAWVEGVPGTSVQPDAPLMRDTGRSVGMVQRLGPAAGDTSGIAPFGLDRWRAAVERARGRPWSAQLAALTPLVAELSAELDRLRAERRPMFHGHGDLDPKNAVVRPDGRVVITDWDGGGPILPGAELVTAAVSFAGGTERADRRFVGEFVAAYHEVSGIAVRPDALAMAIPALADIDWLIDIVEHPGPSDAAIPQPLPGFEGGVEAMRSWAETIARL